jgi:O-antigen chain-terminating methyltransferase
MLKRPVTSEELARLERERADADEAYNRALTALDRALPVAPSLPGAPAPADDGRTGEINALWRILPEQPLPPPRGLRTRLAWFIWRLVAPALQQQQAFNSALVDHLNRNAPATREAGAAVTALTHAFAEHLGAVSTFHAHLIVYLQQLTLYVDSRDRRVAGGLMAVYDPALNAVTDEMLKRWESMVAREQRFAARVAALDGAHDGIRATLATLNQSTLTLKRELERLLSAAAGAGSDRPAAPATAAAEQRAAPHSTIDSYKYVGFEDRFRGSRDEIRRRMADYVADFAGRRDVLDVGCGRGEFLDLLREAGISARGLDLNHEMVEVCRERGLAADEGDWLGYLQTLPDASLGGLIAAQVVEHLEPGYLMRCLDAAYHTLRSGSRIVLETINPACWFAFFESYIRDLTHVRPIHPETLQYLLTASGFQQAEIRFRAPYPAHEKLQPVTVGPDAPPTVRDAAETLNANAERLNRLLFTYLDYAAVATRL